MNKSLKTRYLLLGVVTILVFSCFTTNASAEESINIVCTNSILADFTSNIIKENVTIEYIMPSGVCPAYYDTKPSDADKIVSADIIISFGSPFMEPWLADLLTYNADCSIIECKNMGEWNVPSGAKQYVEHLTNELSAVFPELNDTIQENSRIYLNQIDKKAQELQEMVENSSSINKKVICMQWQREFLEWLGLNVTYSYGSPQGLSLQDELDVINAASTGDICVIVDNLQSGTEFGARVASESGASHVIFTNFPQAIPGTDTYLDMITYNTEQLLKGISTYEYKQGDISAAQSQILSLEIQRNVSLALTGILALLVAILLIMYKKKK